MAFTGRGKNSRQGRTWGCHVITLPLLGAQSVNEWPFPAQPLSGKLARMDVKRDQGALSCSRTAHVSQGREHSARRGAPRPVPAVLNGCWTTEKQRNLPFISTTSTGTCFSLIRKISKFVTTPYSGEKKATKSQKLKT